MRRHRFGLFLAQNTSYLDGDELVALVLEALDDFTNKAALDTVGLDGNEGPLKTGAGETTVGHLIVGLHHRVAEEACKASATRRSTRHAATVVLLHQKGKSERAIVGGPGKSRGSTKGELERGEFGGRQGQPQLVSQDVETCLTSHSSGVRTRTASPALEGAVAWRVPEVKLLVATGDGQEKIRV